MQSQHPQFCLQLLPRISRITMPRHPLRRKHNIQLELLRRLPTGPLMLAHRSRNVLDRVEVDDEVVFDSEDGVGG